MNEFQSSKHPNSNTMTHTTNPQKEEAANKSIRARFRRKAFLIPNLVTVTSIFCGFLSVISAIHGDFEYAAKCIALSIILDGLDGRIARRLNACSEFGVEFDSLSDQVAFGVAPAVLIYQWGFTNIASEFGILIAFLVVACTATRLARFNVTTSNNTHKSSFQGLPSPGAAAALASLVYWSPTPKSDIYELAAVMIYTTLAALLMVSSIAYPSVKHIKLKSITGRNIVNQRKLFALLAIVVAFTWYETRLVIFIGSTLYAVSGIIMLCLPRKWTASKSNEKVPETAEEETPTTCENCNDQ